VSNFVETGQVKVVFWPVLNHGDPSVYSTLTAVCVGQQDPVLFWDIHEYLFQNQRDLWVADRDYYSAAAVRMGADKATFEACYDGSDGLAEVMALDTLRREHGIYSQPTFDINNNIFAGAASYETFAQVFENLPTP
jgi:protein-disulfide isomerase